jgi:hypothetical protein
MVPKRVHDKTRLCEHSFALRDLPLSKDYLEIFAYLLEQLTLRLSVAI